MKERILTGWTFNRLLYLVMGIVIIIQATLIQQWAGILLGGYFASMGIFSMGCAGGNCLGGSCSTKPAEMNANKPHDKK